MSLIPSRWRRPKPPLTAPQPEDAPRAHRDRERLTAPQGTAIWICATPAGPKNCGHNTEAEAEAHGAREGRVWWPITVDDQYGETA